MKIHFCGLLFCCGLLASCQVQPYAPPPQRATVQSVEVTVSEFHGRPEAYATIRGFLSTSAAQLVDTKQSRDGRTIRLEVLEQTPRGANLLTDLSNSPPFEKRVPLELIGLPPGAYRLVANEMETTFFIPSPSSRGLPDVPTHNAAGEPVATEIYGDGRRFEDASEGEWIDIEDTDFVEPVRN